MKSYLKNISKKWQHVLIMSVKPGGKVPIKELFKECNDDFSNEATFIDWLKNSKLNTNPEIWELVKK